MAAAAVDLIARAEKRARRDPAFAGVLADLVAAPTRGAGDYTRSAARALNRERRTDVLVEFKREALTTAQAKQRLGLGTPQAVHQLRRRGRVIGLQAGNATWFPAWQFDSDRLRADLPAILEHLARFTTDPIAADRVMRLARDELDGHSVSDALDDPAIAPTAWVILESLGA